MLLSSPSLPYLGVMVALALSPKSIVDLSFFCILIVVV
jgi:hypothetical protein